MQSAYSFLEGQVAFSHTRWSNNRSVMPLDVRGCTRATMGGSACVYPAPRGAGNPLNPTLSAGYNLALIKSLPFVHTARRYYRLDGLVRSSDRPESDLVPKRKSSSIIWRYFGFRKDDVNQSNALCLT
uniref:Uncharacterized protein n=1 Tax=Denticeps clupeoides TaxID=299321 RepID=A0AAY4AWI8_9TELE